MIPVAYTFLSSSFPEHRMVSELSKYYVGDSLSNALRIVLLQNCSLKQLPFEKPFEAIHSFDDY